MRLQDVGKRYGLRSPWIIRDVSLEVRPGRLIRLEGVNGSGKSTLLRVLAGACLPTAGRVTGRPRTGYVPERFPPGLPFSPRAYLTHLGQVQGLRGGELTRRVDDTLELLGAAQYAAAPMRSLSKGMSQKVAVAQALLPGPGLLVLDEAWTGLDQAARAVLDAAVGRRLADGAAVVFVDHDAARLAGLVTDRWRAAGGQVTAVDVEPAARPGLGAPGQASGPAGGRDLAAGAADGAGPVIIEVSGVSPGAVAGLAGVGAVRDAGERLVIEVGRASSDAVLRSVLSRAGAHVWSVRADPRPAPRAGAAGTRAVVQEAHKPDSSRPDSSDDS